MDFFNALFYVVLGFFFCWTAYSEIFSIQVFVLQKRHDIAVSLLMEKRSEVNSLPHLDLDLLDLWVELEEAH